MRQYQNIGRTRRRRVGVIRRQRAGARDAASGYPTTEHFEAVVTDRVIEEPWVQSKIRPGERVLDVGSATSRYFQGLPVDCKVYAIDLRPTPPQRGVSVLRGDLLRASFRPGSFDVIACISTVEHIGLDIYGQGPDEFGDEVAMRHMRHLLRPGGRVLLTVPFGKRGVFAWHRVYDEPALQRLFGGYRVRSLEYYRMEGNDYVACGRKELEDTAFDFHNMRSGGLALAELTPVGGVSFLVSRLSLRLRRSWRKLTRRGPYWVDPWSGESAAAWLTREYHASREDRQ